MKFGTEIWQWDHFYMKFGTEIIFICNLALRSVYTNSITEITLYQFYYRDQLHTNSTTEISFMPILHRDQLHTNSTIEIIFIPIMLNEIIFI